MKMTPVRIGSKSITPIPSPCPWRALILATPPPLQHAGHFHLARPFPRMDTSSFSPPEKTVQIRIRRSTPTSPFRNPVKSFRCWPRMRSRCGAGSLRLIRPPRPIPPKCGTPATASTESAPNVSSSRRRPAPPMLWMDFPRSWPPLRSCQNEGFTPPRRASPSAIPHPERPFVTP